MHQSHTSSEQTMQPGHNGKLTTNGNIVQL